MQRWQRVAFLVIVAWMLAVGAWANRSWTEKIPLVTPPETEGRSRSFVCGAPFGAKSAEAEEPGPLDHPLSRQPCEVHDERRVVAIVDLALGAFVLAGVVYAGRRSAAHRDTQPVA